jgi:CRISPR-associated endonuclease/helicase Cas3
VLARVSADWNEPRERVDHATLQAIGISPTACPWSPRWRKQAARYARKLLELAPTPERRCCTTRLPCMSRACA